MRPAAEKQTNKSGEGLDLAKYKQAADLAYRYAQERSRSQQEAPGQNEDVDQEKTNDDEEQ